MKVLFFLFLISVLAGCGSAKEPPETPRQNNAASTVAGLSTSTTRSVSSEHLASSANWVSSANASVYVSSSSAPARWVEAPVHQKIIQEICVSCHRSNGAASGNALQFSEGSTELVELSNLSTLATYLLNSDPLWMLEKSVGAHGHGGGEQIALGSEAYSILVEYVELITGENYRENVPATNLILESPAITYRRASLLLTGKVPSVEKLASLQAADDQTLRLAIVELMQGSGFKNFIKRGANDQLLVRSVLESKSLRADFQYYYPKFREKYFVGEETDRSYLNKVIWELAEAPLELIAFVVMNDRPYSEVLTANYTMVSEQMASIYKTGLSPAEKEFLPAVNRGQHVSGTDEKHPYKNWALSRSVVIPHAGVLTEPAFLQQYPTTATNRNRARARWSSLHFLGFDIESSVARIISNTALLDDSNNPTLNNEACTRCHNLLDPIAGAFQNFAERGIYHSNAGGVDSLDDAYRSTPLFSVGDLWYADMLSPGFNGVDIDKPQSALQELGRLIAGDFRFNTAAVKFWWPAIFGEPMFDSAMSSEQYQSRLQRLTTLASAFESKQKNLRQLLADMVMSNEFRIASLLEPSTEQPEISAIKTGGRRLLTPEELANKTASLTGIYDENLAGDLSLLYGGIDSFNTTHRLRRLNVMMSRAAERHALTSACNIVVSDFSLNASSRHLFSKLEPYSTPSAAYARNTVFADSSETILELPINVQNFVGQSIQYVLSSSTDKYEDPELNNTIINTIEVIDPNGALVLEGDARLLYREHDWVTGAAAGAWNSPIKLRQGFNLNIAIPVNISGVYTLRLSAAAVSEGNHLNVSVSPQKLVSNGSDIGSKAFRQQMAHIIERMHGRRYEQDAPEILAYTQLFIDLRNNRIARGAEQNIVEPGLRCGYHGGDVPTRVWGADPFLNLGAWRGVLISLMTDFNYLYE